VLTERVKAGVRIRVIGRLEKAIDGVKVRKLADLRLHVRAIVRDGESAFIGSQSLRKLELDGRREVGIVVNNSHIARQIASVFEDDWSAAQKMAKAS
jgi:phosphatidylserine/phosphatidylglycerophosphate/cardiolipin synthase-like enzyme